VGGKCGGLAGQEAEEEERGSGGTGKGAEQSGLAEQVRDHRSVARRTTSGNQSMVMYRAPATGTRSQGIVHRQPAINNKLAPKPLTLT